MAYLECRQLNFPGKPKRTIGARPATLADLTCLSTLAKLAYERVEGGPGHGVYDFCWNRNQNAIDLYRHQIESALRDRNKGVYVFEDTSFEDHELFAAAIVSFQNTNGELLAPAELSLGPEYARWVQYYKDVSQMWQTLGANNEVHIQDFMIKPEYSYIQTHNPQNPEPFLAKALFHFLYSYPDKIKKAPEITAIVPTATASWLYRKLGFEEVPRAENTKRILPPTDTPDPGSESGTAHLDVQLVIWRRRSYSP